MGRSRSAFLGLLLFPALVLGSSSSIQAPTSTSGTPDLSRLLALAADYCDRLSRASIDFVCLESVSETIVETKPFIRPSPHGLPTWYDTAVEHQYLYDYQFIVENGQKTEKRRLLEIDGIKKKGDASYLHARSFLYKNVLFGAVDLLAGSRQGFYHYEIKGRESLGGQAALVIDAAPRPGLPGVVNSGTAWLREEDGAILKIAWNVKAMGNDPDIREMAKAYKSMPEILQVTEFGLEKNRVRFPSRFHIEEAYISEKGRRTVRSILDAVYRDYKFFTVAVETGPVNRS